MSATQPCRWPGFTPPHWPAFAPPLTLVGGCCTRRIPGHVQVLHLHDPEYAEDIEQVTRPGGALDALFKMKEEGLATAVGLAMGRVDLMLSLVKDYPFDLILSHNRYTLLNRNADALFEFASANRISILNAAPFAGGVLAKGSSQVQRLTYQEANERDLEPVRSIEQICSKQSVPLGAAACSSRFVIPEYSRRSWAFRNPDEYSRPWTGLKRPCLRMYGANSAR
ncbi:hypothetical protein QO002_000116 [Pararhizobium capsulatum DSM 1112]|uniref:NADP-dependent oxidoreductase domain-containing protein n=1 Tax=Pararhizobium capsulatum DSM 1112 TaxID=1121113 RepID=A0ABU0BJC0_9HYPH|nr:aldo/keto reductase [Pararhizobium capsulatum]MDQ0317978.1 hypothetical protein [Pararhizobium capsulatum DSM 1112]